jgi:hypothetical protein
MSYLIIQFKKDEILSFPQVKSLKKLVNLVTNSFTLQEYEQSRFNLLKFYGNGTNDWEEFNKITTPKEWLSIYKYSKEYGNWSTITNSCDSSWNGNILDFGAGAGLPWNNIHSNMNLYLLEANLTIAEKLKETYSSYDNVKVITSFKEILNVKFNYIYSKDVLEHVRYINEHLDILYYLGNQNCSYNLSIDPAPSGGHVLNLHPDTVINEFWSQFKK